MTVTLKSLHLYPLKSCRGIDLEEALLGARGLEAAGVGDREWMVADPEGNFLTQRECPALARVAVRLADAGSIACAASGRELMLPAAPSAPRRVQARIWGASLPALDEGDEAAAWFSGVLGRPARLLRFDPAVRRASNRGWTGSVEALNRFSDGYPMLLASEASLADFNARWQRAGHVPLPMSRFRPNLVIAGAEPYDEDHFAALSRGNVELKPVKACPRCTIPSVDQSSGEVGPAPLELLSEYRHDPRAGGATFGQNVIVLRGEGARLRVGQAFSVAWTF